MKAHTRLPSWALSITALAASVCCSQTFAQSTDSQQLERVEVTGSNIKRSSRETSSPIDVITAKDIQASGARTALDVMKMIPAIGNDGFNDTPTQNSFSRGVATVSLRNQSATSTLVLINGRRMSPAAYANPNNGTSTLYDLNRIPSSSIERVEVFKDGASAVYGSDAIAGVINFITKNNYQGLETKVLAGANEQNDYTRQTLSVTAGIGDVAANGYNVFVGIDYTHKGRSMVGDSTDKHIHADDYRAINLRRNPYGSYLYNDQPWLIKESAPGNKSFPVTSAANMVTAGNCPASEKISNTTSDVYGITTGGLANRTFCNYNLDQFAEMQNPGNDIGVMSRGTLKLSDNLTGFAEVNFSRSKRHYLAAPRTISGTAISYSIFNINGIAGSFQPILEVGHPDNPFPNARAAVQMRFPSASGSYDLTNTAYRALAGVRGTVGKDIDWESALLMDRSHRDEYYYGFLRLPVLRQMLGTAYGGTNRSLASIAADKDLSHPILNGGTGDIYQWDLKASTEVGQLPGGAIGLAGGIEIRRESINLVPDPDVAAGNVFGLANTNVKGSRNVESAFVEVVAPLTKTLELDLAGRVDKYPHLKANFVPKIGAKWTANSVLTLRGDYSEGFRAPAVSQSVPGGAQYFLNGIVDPIRCNTSVSPAAPKPGADPTDCSKSVAGVGGYNPNLRPENSYSSSFGVILSPIKDVDVLATWWRIRKNSEVALAGGQSIIDHPEAYPANLLVRDTNPALLLNGQAGTGPLLTIATPWLNQGSTMTEGLDLEFKSIKRIFESVKWTTSIAGTYMLKYERIEKPGYASNNLVGTRGGVADWATSAPDVPRLKLRASSTFDMGSNSVMIAANYVSGLSFIRRQDGTNEGGVTPKYYSGSTCHYGNPGGTSVNPDGLTNRSVLGAATTATNGRDFYGNRYPGCSMSSWLTLDASYTYTGFKNLTLSLAVQNLADSKAPYDPTGGQLGYNAGMHNGLGRYYTVSAGYKFW